MKRGELANHLRQGILTHLQSTVEKYERDIENERKERLNLQATLEKQILEQKHLILSLRTEVNQLKGAKSSISTEVSNELEYTAGLKLWEKDHWIESLPYFEKAAQLGYPPAILRVHSIKRFVVGESERNHWRDIAVKNLEWFKKKSTEGPSALFNYAYCFYLKSNNPKAFAIAMEAAEKGYAPAEWLVGYCLLGGKGTAKHEDIAIAWLFKSANQGFAPAQHALGEDCILNHDLQTGIEWLQAAGKQGYVVSQYLLAKHLEKIHPPSSSEWLEKAIANGYAPAQIFRNKARLI